MHDNDTPTCSLEQTAWNEVVIALRERLLIEAKNKKLKLHDLTILTELIARAMDLNVNSENFDGMKKSFHSKLESEKSFNNDEDC